MDYAHEEGKRHPEARGTPGALTCEQVTSLIIDYLTGTLDDATVAAFEGHLQGCRDCRAFLKTYEKTIQATRSLAYDEVPAEMVQRVQQFLRQRMGLGNPGQ